MDYADDLFTQMERDELSPELTASKLFARLRELEFLPHPGYAFGNPDTLHNDFTAPSTLAKIILWGKLRAPKPMRKEIFDLPLGTLQKIELEGRVLSRFRKRDRLEGRQQPAVVAQASL